MRKQQFTNFKLSSELQEIWGKTLSPDELKAFVEWNEAYSADEQEYLSYEAEYIEGSEIAAHEPVLTAQYFNWCAEDDHTGCSTKGSNSKIGTNTIATLPGGQNVTVYDGNTNCTHTTVSTWEVRYGHTVVMVADQGTELPPSEDLPPSDLYEDLPPSDSEPILTAQNLGYNQYHAWFLFDSLGVPKNAIINYAELELTTSWELGYPEASLSVWIKAQKTVDPDPPTAYDWPTIEWTGNWKQWDDTHEPVLDETFYSENFACVIQELVEQETWNENAGALIVLDPKDEDHEYPYGYRAVYDSRETNDQDKWAHIRIWYSVKWENTGSGGVAGGGTATFVYNEVGTGGVSTGGSAKIITPWFETEWHVADAIDNTGLERATYNIDNYLFLDVQLTAKANSSFAAGDHVDLYVVCEKLDQDGSSYEEGNVTIGAPAANYLGSFIFGATGQTQTHILRMVPIPPLMFRLMLLNSAATIDELTLTVRPYRYQTSEI